ncbi:MAG: 3'-5' exonuclease domain-containing protein 2 [Pseudomonadales bacterium]|nr:3'-5' exonuclease domain-containing protein 2 [Pseudomonadales bacterium]
MTFNFVRPSKDDIRELPVFSGLDLAAITVVSNDAELEKAVELLGGNKHVGFDTESKPTFQKGETSDGPHVIQIAVSDHAFLFTAHYMPGVELALGILKDCSIKKYGFGLKGDKGLFRKKYDIEAVEMIDLARVLKQAGELKNDVGARAAVAMLFQQRLTKSAQRSNWSKYPLTNQQIKYAANDAYAGFCIADVLQDLEILER